MSWRALTTPEVADYLNGYTTYTNVIETEHGVLVED